MSGYKLRPEYSDYDAERIFEVHEIDTNESSICISGQILRGIKKPHDCPAFGTLCTPLDSAWSHDGFRGRGLRRLLRLRKASGKAENRRACGRSRGRCSVSDQSLAAPAELAREVPPQPSSGEPTTSAMPGTSCPLPITRREQIVLGPRERGQAHRATHRTNFPASVQQSTLDKLDDQAVLQINGSRLAFTTDSFVVTPIFFPGGDIGQLAVNGTVNDLAMSGARPLYLAAGFILEEGLAIDDLLRVVDSMATAAKNAGVQLVTGDTKVVNRGQGR